MKTSKPFGEISSRVCFQSKCAGSAEWGDVRRHDAGRQMPDAAMSRGGWVFCWILQRHHSSLNVLWFASDGCWNSIYLLQATTLLFWW